MLSCDPCQARGSLGPWALGADFALSSESRSVPSDPLPSLVSKASLLHKVMTFMPLPAPLLICTSYLINILSQYLHFNTLPPA